MKFIQGHKPTHIILFPVSLYQSIDPDNEVRTIDLFVDSHSLKDYGFIKDYVENGHPAYHPSELHCNHWFLDKLPLAARWKKTACKILLLYSS